MNNTQLYIPKKCKVGFNLRTDTYTGKLGYIIYSDGKVWRKEKSWESWRQKPGGLRNEWDPETRQYTKEVYGDDVAHIEFDNVPTEGFVLNKKVGGTSSGWDHRQTYSRVYDPRGWEFEITVPNLLYILQECSSFKGKGLEGQFVYSWHGKDLVLLPVSSPDYVACEEYTDLQSKKIGKKDMTVGCVYLTSKQEKMVYLGVFPVSQNTWDNKTLIESGGVRSDRVKFEPQHVFVNLSMRDRYPGYDNIGSFEYLTAFGRLKMKLSDEIHPQFAEFVDDFQKSEYATLADHLEVRPFDDKFVDRNYTTYVYKFGEMNSMRDVNDAKKDVRKTKDADTYDVFRHEERESYGWNKPAPVPIEVLTLTELKAKYGRLVRVYRNGYTKNV